MVGIKCFGQLYHGGICFCENITQEITQGRIVG